VIGAVATGITWFKAFKGPCLLLSGAALIAGAAGGWAAASKLGEAKIASAREVAADARADLARLQQEQTQAIADAAAKNVLVSQDVLGEFHATKESLRDIRDDIGGLRRAVRLCSSVSAMPVPGPAARADEAPASEQPRPAADVLADLATGYAERADRNAAQVNAVIDWLEKVGGKAGQR
jgi:hypothetical protein